jgi:transcriptional regulator with XRE-family HTH domain
MKHHSQSRLGVYLKEARIKRGLTQKSVSDTLGYSTPQFVSNWERGLSPIPIDTLKTLLKLYSLSLSEIVNKAMEEQEASLREAFGSKKKRL